MIALLRERLTPYWRQILLVLGLLFVQAITNLYLPTLNADIINNGVVKGDTHYIMVTGALMLGVTLVLVIATVIAVYWGSKTAMAFGRDVRGAPLSQGRELLAGRAQPLRYALADHTLDQRCPAGADGRAHDAQPDPRGADHGHRRHHHGAAPRRAAVERDPGRRAHHGGLHRPRGHPCPAALQVDAEEDRPHQPGHARGAQRRARDPRLRPRRLRGAALRRRPTPTSPARRCG